jgi:ribose transport system substrate-binding protein
MKRILLIAVLITAIVGVLPIFAAGGQQAKSGNINVAYIAMDSMDQHWQIIRRAAEEKAKELGNVTLTFNAPAGKNDAAVQLQMVEDAINKKADVLMLAPLDADSLVPTIERAYDAGIKIIFVDTKANTEKYHSFLGTDNAAAARLDAQELGKALGGQGKIAIVNAQAGAFTTMTRENAFKEEIAKSFPGITIVGTQYSDGDRTKALNIATDFMTANPDLKGFYGCNDGATVGAANGLEQAGKANSIVFIGWDWSEDHQALIRRGVLKGTLVQSPYNMGYNGLQAGIDAVQGKSIPKFVDTGVTFVNQANVDSLDPLTLRPTK